MDRFVISFGEWEYLKDVDETIQPIITGDFQESAIFEIESDIWQRMFEIVREKILMKVNFWEKIYIDLKAR